MSWTVERARIAGLSRDRDPDDPDLIAAKRNLRYEMLLDHVRKVATTQPLTDEQMTRITEILHTEPIEAKENLRFDTLTDRVRELVTDKPLTDEQRTRITEILHTAGGLGDD